MVASASYMMRRAIAAILLALLGAIGGLAIHLATAKGPTLFSGKRPENLGIHQGRLASCGRRLNCVSSQANPGDARRYVAPIGFLGSAPDAMQAARRAVESMPGATVARQEANYLHAEFRSRWFGFVDDVEFTYDERARQLHLRSASRLGRRDFDVNRRRVEALRSRIESGVRA